MVAVHGRGAPARSSTELPSMFKRAAELQSCTLTDFVVSAVKDAAQQSIERAEVVQPSLADQKCIAQALLSPPTPSPAWPIFMFGKGHLRRTVGARSAPGSGSCRKCRVDGSWVEPAL